MKLQEEWKIMSEQQLQRIREKHSEEISSLDQAEAELRNKLVNLLYYYYTSLLTVMLS